MLFTTLFAFIVPWAIIFFILKIDLKIIVLIAPITAVLTFTLDAWTIAYGFASVYPFSKETNFASLPMALGVMPVCASIFIYLVKRYAYSLAWIVGFTLFSTLLEWFFVQMGLIRYENNWNIGWTALEYVTGYTGVFGYYKVLRKLELL
ncbi:CBO0543 family protein [Jeotgalibacillus proteolyticus]|uniref:CBO0543 family protein n=1 Tax=Jeotgalibacillus proteolyticus TaxID=2082395 RepID=UPI003CE9668A